MTMTWSSATVVGTIEINIDEKFRQIAGHFDHHADGVMQRRVNHPMGQISGFTQEAPLDAATGTVPGPHCPGGRHGRQFVVKQKTLTKSPSCHPLRA
jgi:hypothetical protein